MYGRLMKRRTFTVAKTVAVTISRLSVKILSNTGSVLAGKNFVVVRAAAHLSLARVFFLLQKSRHAHQMAIHKPSASAHVL